jgi:multidrug efflux pump
MHSIIDFFIDKYKSTLLLFILIFTIGYTSYINIPKESNPSIEQPYIVVNISLSGISPQDSEKLLVKPLENELKNVTDVIYYESEAGQGFAWVFVEFSAGTDTNVAMDNVRDAVNIAKRNLPTEAEEPTIEEYSSSRSQPVLSLSVSGDMDFSILNSVSEKLEEQLKSIPQVLSVNVRGNRKEVIDITLSSTKMASYNINQNEVLSLFSNNNILIPAGNIDTENGSISLKVDGKIDTIEQILNTPIKVFNDFVLKFSDIATVNRIYKTPTSFARINGENTIGLSITKRQGDNILETVAYSKSVVEAFKEEIPQNVHITYTFDGSKDVLNLLSDLENNIISSVILVFLVILAALGFRSSILVGFAIPGAFLIGIIVLYYANISMNMVVLFSLIMSIGMLVDGAIVVSEYADKKMLEGLDKKEAFRFAAKRMSLPIISSTATTLAAFLPLLFWGGTTGQFMIYLPITLIFTLTASIFMALVFIPTLGSVFGKVRINEKEINNLKSIENKEFNKLTGLESLYYPLLNLSLKNPKTTIFSIILASLLIIISFTQSNNGTIFFPEGNSDNITLYVKAEGDYSIYEKDEMVKEVESILLSKYKDNIKYFYVRAITDEYNIGRINLTLPDWKERPASSFIADQLREEFKHISGLRVEVSESRQGPSSDKEIEMDISSNNFENLFNGMEELDQELRKLDYIVDLINELPKNGLQWSFDIDREKAALYGTSIAEIGSTLQMLTDGIKITEYIPDDLDEYIDVRVRFNKNDRNIQTLQTLTVNTNKGLVPLSTFVTLEYKPKIISIFRLNGVESRALSANLKEGVLLSEKMDELNDIVKKIEDKHNISVYFSGDSEEQDSTSKFLINAFYTSIFLMFLILVAQFNSYYQTFVVLSAIVFSTTGVVLLLYILEQPFGIVMGGIGIISLAGIVINNNIVLIDTFNEKMIKHNNDHIIAITETCLERFRPVFLTTITTILGLIPMAFKLNIDTLTGVVLYDSPSSQFWYQLAYSIIGGMSFAFFITLFMTPALLIVFKNIQNPFKKINNIGVKL